MPCHEHRVLRLWSNALSQGSGKRKPQDFLPLGVRAELPAIEAELAGLAAEPEVQREPIVMRCVLADGHIEVTITDQAITGRLKVADGTRTLLVATRVEPELAARLEKFGVPYTLSTMSICSIEDVREATPVGDIVNHMSSDTDSVAEAGAAVALSGRLRLGLALAAFLLALAAGSIPAAVAASSPALVSVAAITSGSSSGNAARALPWLVGRAPARRWSTGGDAAWWRPAAPSACPAGTSSSSSARMATC